MIMTALSLFRRRHPIDLFSLLRLAWCLLVLWLEFGSFYFSLRHCRWPDSSFTRPADSSHVLIVDDAQVRLGPGGSQGNADRFRYRLYDYTLRKNWKFASKMRPNVVIFLGDMLASGHRVEDDAEYRSYVQRFKDIFRIPKATEVYHAPGNEDVGLRLDWKTARIARNHYSEHFGIMNGWVIVANHTFVILDAPGLVEEDYQRAEKGSEYEDWVPKADGAIDFLKAMAQTHAGDANHPIILFTHIPLSRPELASCGPLRERGTIHRGVGLGYQNTFGKTTSQSILRDVRPSLIFSGDDRDYCDYVHRHPTSEATIRELTVKSFSPAKYIRYPGFHLLSVVDPSTVPPGIQTFAHQPCVLPDYINVYRTRYLPLFILTFIVLLISINRRRKNIRPLSSLPSFTSDTLLYGRATWPPLDGDVVDGLPPSSPQFTFMDGNYGDSHNSLHPPLRTPTTSANSSSSNLKDSMTTSSLRASLYASPPLDSSFISSMSSSPHLDKDLTGGTMEASLHEGLSDPVLITRPLLRVRGERNGWKRSWSWIFVFWGRRRRITLTLPPLWCLPKFWPRRDAAFGGVERRTGRIFLLQYLLHDLCSVMLPAFSLWTLFALWTLW